MQCSFAGELLLCFVDRYAEMAENRHYVHLVAYGPPLAMQATVECFIDGTFLVVLGTDSFVLLK